MFNVYCGIIRSEPNATASDPAIVCAQAIYYSARREAMLIPCTDMSVLFKRMSAQGYKELVECALHELSNGCVNFMLEGDFMRAPSMLEVDSLIARNHKTFVSTTISTDFGGNRTGLKKMNVDDLI